MHATTPALQGEQAIKVGGAAKLVRRQPRSRYVSSVSQNVDMSKPVTGYYPLEMEVIYADA